MLNNVLWLTLIAGSTFQIVKGTNTSNTVEYQLASEILENGNSESPILFTPTGIKSGAPAVVAEFNLAKLGQCPEGFLYKNTPEADLCYTIRPRETFPPKCPYPSFLSLTDRLAADILSDYQQNPLWLMLKRNTVDSFGVFEWIINSKSYGQPFYHYDGDYNNLADRECMVINNNKFLPVSCNATYTAVCIYPYNHQYISNYCQKHYAYSIKYDECIADSFDIENHNCYCESEQEQATARPLICDTLAEPLIPFQSDLLVHQLSTVQDVCWIGLYQNSKGAPWWNRANVQAEYEYWSTDVDRSKPFGAMKFIDNTGWILAEDDHSIKCGICEIKNNYDKNVSVQLKFEPSTQLIKVRIQNPLEISDYFGERDSLFCFVGPTSSHFKESLDDLMGESKSNYQNDETEWISHFDNDLNFPVYYSCEAFQHPNLKPVFSNQILVYNTLGGYEYAFQIKTSTTENKDPYVSGRHIEVRSYIYEKLEYDHPSKPLRLMKITKFEQPNLQMEMLFHLTTAGVSADEQSEYYDIKQRLDKMVMEATQVLELISFGRSDVCLPLSELSGTKLLHWPKTSIGVVALPINIICLQQNGEPVMRQCKGDFLHGGYWSKTVGNCWDATVLSDRTLELYELLHRANATADEISEALSNITKSNKGVTVFDIYLISEILQKLAAFDAINIIDVVEIISNVMDFESSALKKSQILLNCTDKILNSLDSILENVKLDKSNPYYVIRSTRLLLQINDVESTNITGLALEGNFESNFTLLPIYNNSTLEAFLEQNVELAAFLPNSLVTEIEDCLPDNSTIQLVVAIFYNDVLFNENVKKTRQTNSRILNILIPNFDCMFSTQIPVIFRPIHDAQFEKQCAYWSYGLSELHDNIKGSWLEEGVPTQNHSYAVCGFDHLTHFALLMMGTFSKHLPEKHAFALNIITAIGAALSLTSIVAMFIFAALFENWRRVSSNKIILNFSIAIALQIILLYVAESVRSDGALCIAIGAGLHYAILSEFLWMLVIAILQYKKFVTVFQKRTRHIMAKSCVISWGLPLIPIAVLLAASSDSYRKNPHGLCYLSDKYFYFGVILPVTLIVLINTFIFIQIVFSVCHKKVDAYGSTDDDAKLQVFLAVLLFFLLGISWLFGLVSSFGGGILFSYLFCFTATFQGLVMFVFFVVMNDNCKTWWASFRATHCSKKQKRRVSTTSFSQTQITEGTETTWRIQPR